jgi:hypothetical protein
MYNVLLDGEVYQQVDTYERAVGLIRWMTRAYALERIDLCSLTTGRYVSFQL